MYTDPRNIEDPANIARLERSALTWVPSLWT